MIYTFTFHPLKRLWKYTQCGPSLCLKQHVWLNRVCRVHVFYITHKQVLGRTRASERDSETSFKERGEMSMSGPKSNPHKPIWWNLNTPSPSQTQYASHKTNFCSIQQIQMYIVWHLLDFETQSDVSINSQTVHTPLHTPPSHGHVDATRLPNYAHTHTNVQHKQAAHKTANTDTIQHCCVNSNHGNAAILRDVRGESEIFSGV